MISLEPLPRMTFAGEAVLRRDRLAQVITTAVGVELGAVEGGAHGLDGLGRGTEGILVGSQLDDLLGREP